MPIWLIPALKAILPHIGTIVSTAAPVFTKRSTDNTAANQANAQINQMQVLQQQITELQAAASANDAHIKALAAQLQTAVTALELGAATAEKKQIRTLVIAATSMALSLVALALAIVANAS